MSMKLRLSQLYCRDEAEAYYYILYSSDLSNVHRERWTYRDIKRRTLTIISRRLHRSGETFGWILEKIDEGPSRFPSISKRSNFQANGETNY